MTLIVITSANVEVWKQFIKATSALCSMELSLSHSTVSKLEDLSELHLLLLIAETCSIVYIFCQHAVVSF